MGNAVGRTLEVAGANNKVPCGLKVRVCLELDRALLRGLRIRFTDGRHPLVVIFRYERLSDFCYTCGRLDHIEGNCHERRVASEHGAMVRREYGDWLRDGAEAFVPERVIELLEQSGYKAGEQVVAPASITHSFHAPPELPTTRTEATLGPPMGAPVTGMQPTGLHLLQTAPHMGLHSSSPSMTRVLPETLHFAAGKATAAPQGRGRMKQPVETARQRKLGSKR